ncbi:MAG: chemotaxis response regulator protein-glutamate methylesterase [Proteobacteria bacterium]|nr:chemotaxis response regulator protein-glutamate methylesterase [Pseudomonadota bacterium]
MSRPIRVLVVDDAVVIRRSVSKILSEDPEIEVVAVAANGRIALSKLPLAAPDLVILDMEMPDMDGLQTLAALSEAQPELPVIMFSAHTERGAAATLKALSLGAADYVPKPARIQSPAIAAQCVRDQLIPKIKALCSMTAGFEGSPNVAPRQSQPAGVPYRAREHAGAPIGLLAIGASTGGPKALESVLDALPADFPVPTLIVQHMPPLFTRLLAASLSSGASVAVREGYAGAALRPGQVWIAPGDAHMMVARQGSTVRLQIHKGPEENSCRPAVDVLFRSVADVYGARALAVLLTGIGQDGLRGCERIREAGGRVYVQDATTSVVWGMPGFVANAGLAHRILPLAELSAEIAHEVMASRATGAGAVAAGDKARQQACR